jgi:hypothetical protein
LPEVWPQYGGPAYPPPSGAPAPKNHPVHFYSRIRPKQVSSVFFWCLIRCRILGKQIPIYLKSSIMEPFETFYKSFPFFKSLAWLVFFKGSLYALKLIHANASKTWNKKSKENTLFLVFGTGTGAMPSQSSTS